jgi:hypothetical protein
LLARSAAPFAARPRLHIAAQKGAFGDADARAAQVADDPRTFFETHAVFSGQVPGDGAAHGDASSRYVGLDERAFADGDLACHFDVTLDPPADLDVAIALDAAAKEYSLSDYRDVRHASSSTDLHAC